MPITISSKLLVPKVKPVPGRLSYNATIAKLAPEIAAARKNGHHGIEEIAQYLNARGIVAPSGRSFTYTTLQRIIHRLCKMGMAEPLRTVSDALRDRPSMPRASRESIQAAENASARSFREIPQC